MGQITFLYYLCKIIKFMIIIDYVKIIAKLTEIKQRGLNEVEAVNALAGLYSSESMENSGNVNCKTNCKELVL